MDKVKTGILGLDEITNGGIPIGSSVLVSGGAGTGKSILAMQYLYEGATKFKEPGLLITLETNLKNIVWNMESFNWDIKKLQDENLIKIYRLNLTESGSDEEMRQTIDRELKIISAMVDEIGAKRLVVDSTTAFGVWASEKGVIRSLLYRFTNALKDLDCTSLLTAETNGDKNSFSAFGVEEFIVDAVIALYFSPPHRSIFVRKMRGTDHSKTVHPFSISSQGIDIKSRDEISWEAIK